MHAQAQNGATPLHFAAYYGHLDTAKFLVEKGANINVEDNYKNTPMGLAIAQNKQDIIEFFNVLLPTPNSSLEGVSTCSGNTRLQK
ncbi:ankyrin repeat domain-containing protein [Wolbachia endosymbiont (group A) of Pogonocherus hispidulus]|uniref:ankyrin repeat domain-containing protein n=1 Tax=Wolbachia endosymbiont (group A) of Pogonocherus hispidulus TaxID=3066136 RepID=UPI00333F9128